VRRVLDWLKSNPVSRLFCCSTYYSDFCSPRWCCHNRRDLLHS